MKLFLICFVSNRERNVIFVRSRDVVIVNLVDSTSNLRNANQCVLLNVLQFKLNGFLNSQTKVNTHHSNEITLVTHTLRVKYLVTTLLHEIPVNARMEQLFQHCTMQLKWLT